MTMIIDGTNGLTFPDNSRQYNGYFGFKNRIINGAMVIDQRNAGASVTPADTAYTLDRWQSRNDGKFSVVRSTVAPAGFINSLLVTSLSSYSVGANDFYTQAQQIEGFNVSDLAWGTASASQVTLSFWVRSSLTGTFGGALRNSANNRSYVFSYSISSANTWEQKSIAIAGDTSGTWLTDNGVGIRVEFGLGVGSNFSGAAGSWGANANRSVTGAVSVVGTNGATFYITGVQLEEGVVSTNFDVLPYTTQLQLCQRYFETYALNDVSFVGNSTSSTGGSTVLRWYTPKRAAPTITLPAAGQTSGTITFLTAGGGFPSTTGTHTLSAISVDKATINGGAYVGLTSASASMLWSSGTSTIQISAEL